MPLISPADAPTFTVAGSTFVGLASPLRGAAENAVWVVALAPATSITPDRLTREHIIVGIEGRVLALVEDEKYVVTAGSALIVPPKLKFCLTNTGKNRFLGLAILPVGGRSVIADGEPVLLPWSA